MTRLTSSPVSRGRTGIRWIIASVCTQNRIVPDVSRCFLIVYPMVNIVKNDVCKRPLMIFHLME
ncbi:MAG: hypothetical protein VB020_07805 [Methanocorpusculum sp.]|nr:hypothetical protein [Methanocorpusculum sp.]